jgi:sulfur-oxidizing protein SoxA
MIKNALMTLSATVLAGSLAWAGEDSSLVVEGQEIKIRAQAPAHVENLDMVYSGWVFRKDETQALQMDDFDNPAFVFVDDGIDLFNKIDGSAGKSCASCHADVAEFSGLRAKMPRVVDGQVVSMEQLVNGCRTKRSL